MKRSLLLSLFAGLLLCASGEIGAEPLADSKHHFSLDLPAAFVTQEPGSALYRYASPAGLRASISRIDFPSLQAYWRKERKRYFAELERGAAKSSEGYRLKSRKDHREAGTPVYDLHFERKHRGERELVWMRFLLYRRYAIVLTVTSPRKARRKERKAARALAASLMPYSEDEN